MDKKTNYPILQQISTTRIPDWIAEVRRIQQLSLFEVSPSVLDVSTETNRRNGRRKNGKTPASIPFQILLPEEISNE